METGGSDIDKLLARTDDPDVHTLCRIIMQIHKQSGLAPNTIVRQIMHGSGSLLHHMGLGIRTLRPPTIRRFINVGHDWLGDRRTTPLAQRPEMAQNSLFVE